MRITFRYGKADRLSWVVTLIVLGAMGALSAVLFASAEGAYYIAAWATSICVAVGVLFLLSKPTRIILNDKTLELRCLLDTTYLPVDSIVDIGGEGFSQKIPLFASFGFWGYFGRYADLKGKRLYHVYATNRKQCVAIHTSRRRYLISCRNAELLVSLVLDARSRKAQE